MYPAPGTHSHNGGVLGLVGLTAKWVRAGQQAECGRKEKILVGQLAFLQLLIFNSNSFLSEPIGGDPLWSWLTSAGSGCLRGAGSAASPPWAPQSSEWLLTRAARQLVGSQETEGGGSRLHAPVTPPVVERSQGHRKARGVTQVELPPQSWDRE